VRKAKLFIIPVVLICVALIWLSQTNTPQEIIKSPNDQKTYQAITLSNKLNVLLISDPSTDKASAALDVNIGSADDPIEFQGLAHFLEHMLFLGTQKFPNPDEYQKFISDHGGSHNAFTSQEHTNYFFDINADNFEPALERFSAQFITPLFNEEYVDREVNAVHSEYSSKIKDDGRRFFSALKAILANDHPYKKFSVGNLETLKDTPDKSLRAALLSFYDAHYSANQMRLVILGKEPLETLQKWAEDKFSNIPNKDLNTTDIKTPFFAVDFLPAKIEVNSIMDRRSMSIAFPVPSAANHKTSQPVSYLANLIGHEGKGSLLSALKAKKLVDSLSAGAQFDTKNEAIFTITMSLTKNGLEQQEKVLETFFAYVELLREKGIEKHYFDEQAQMLNISFNYQEKSEPIHLTSSLAGALQTSEAADVLFERYNLSEYQPELYTKYLNLLIPSNMLVAVSAKSIKGDSKSKWYETPYQVKTLSSELLTKLTKPRKSNELNLPEENIFIPDNIQLLEVTNNLKPELIQQTPGLDIWFSADTSFGTPKANLFVTIRSPAPMQSAKNLNLTELMVSLLKDSLNEFSYPAYLAGLHYELYNHMRGITIKISGYNDKQSTLLKKILETFKYKQFDNERFSIIKERLKRKLENAKDKKPYEQAIAEIQRSILQPSWNEAQRLTALKKLSVSDLETFRKQFFQTIDTAILSSGNIKRSSTLKIGKQLESIILRDTNKENVLRANVANLEGEQAWFKQIQVDHPDTGFVYFLQGSEKSFSERAMFLLISQIISTNYYAQIRTDKQLGYIVFATNFNMLEVPGLAFIVQSPNTDGRKLFDETSLFLKEQAEKMENLSKEDIKQYQSAVVSRLLKKDNTLYQRSNRNWQEIDNLNTNFDTKDQLANLVNKLTPEDVQVFFSNLIKQKGSSLLVYSSADEQTDKPPHDDLARLENGTKFSYFSNME